VPVGARKRVFDMPEMRAIGRLQAVGSAHAPHRSLEAIAPCPGFAFVNQLDAVAFLPGLQVKTAGAHFFEQRGKEEIFLFARLDDENRRIHSSGDKQGSSAERIAEQQFVIFGIEKVSSGHGNLAARYATKN